MKRAAEIGILLGLCLVLAGADRGCFVVDYGTCSSLGEAACLENRTCQAVYGYPQEWLAGGMPPRCGESLRCILPEEVFIECVPASADPCSGLSESECWRRTACEAVYSFGGCQGDTCWDGVSFEQCRRRAPQCRTADDCYAVFGRPAPDCLNPRLSCEQGVCVEHCFESDCGIDADCGQGRRCQTRCDKGRCLGVCVEAEEECLYHADCGEGRFCEPLADVDCAPGAGCPGQCRQGVWMKFEPVLCPPAPWLADEEINPQRYYDCYHDCCSGGDGDTDGVAEEICRVRTFLLYQGILAHDVRRVHVQDIMCVRCEGCPRGDVIYVLVSPDHTEKMRTFGFSPYQ